MNIKERLVRQDNDDTIFIGELVERTLNGRFGEVLRAYINGLITANLKDEQRNPTDRMPLSADRILGRCEGYNNVLYGLEQMIEDAKSLQVPIEEDEEIEE